MIYIKQTLVKEPKKKKKNLYLGHFSVFAFQFWETRFFL